MRLNLYWRGRDIIDIEAHVWKKRRCDDEVFEEAPSLQAASHLAASELANDVAPDTRVFGFTGGPHG